MKGEIYEPNINEKVCPSNRKYWHKYTKGQILVINAPIEGAEFTRLVTEYAYQKAQRSYYKMNDEISTKLKYLYADEEIFDEYPSYLKEFYLSYSQKGCLFNNLCK